MLAITMVAAGFGCAAAVGDAPVGETDARHADELGVRAAGGAADDGAFVSIAPDSTATGSITPFPGGEMTAATLRGHVGLWQVQLAAGQTVAVLMARTAGDLDPYLIVIDPDGTRYTRDDQALLPMVAEHDALAIHAAPVDGTYTILAADAELKGTGSYALHVVAVDAPLADLDATNPALRGITEELRGHEAQLGELIAQGGLAEMADGYVSSDTEGFLSLPLADRADARRLEHTVNYLRDYLYREHLRASDVPDDDQLALSSVRSVSATLFAFVRSGS
jgi:hypothetical protein